MKNNQGGFTLVEIAIVLVIIGLLLGGVLKGQELINSAKVKNFATDFRNIPLFIYGYQDKYRALPGDDKNAEAHVGAKTNGDGNGVIGGNWDATSGESFNFWQHVRLAGLAAGTTDTAAADYLPKNADGGQIGIASGVNSPITTLKGSYIICSSSILGRFAKQLDITMDDGSTATGSMQVIGSGAAASTTAGTGTGTGAASNADVADAATFTVCLAF